MSVCVSVCLSVCVHMSVCVRVCVCVCECVCAYLRQTEGDGARDHSGVALDREHKLVVGGGLHGHMSVEEKERRRLKLPNCFQTANSLL